MIKLYNYQSIYIRDLPPKVIMAADTGVGKTYLSIGHYAKHAKGEPLLILAPASKVRTGDWETSIEEYFGKSHNIQFEIYSYEKFSRNISEKELNQGKHPIWTRFSPKHGGKQWAVIADEVHKAKNPQSLTGKALYFVTKDAGFFTGLSATALMNGWIDFANYSKIFGFTRNLTEFKRKYCNFVNYRGFPELKNYINEDELRLQWQAITRQLTRDEATELPPQTFIGVDFKKPVEYTKIMKTRITPEGKILDNAPALSHALRQTLSASKIEYISDILSGTNENVIIFYNYESERLMLLDMLTKSHKNKNIYEQNGTKHNTPDKKQWPKVKNSVTLGHYRSASTGIELTYGTIIVYFSPTYSYGEYTQSIGRVFRNGQTNKTLFYCLRTVDTIEEAIWECLKGKSNFQEQIWYDNTIVKSTS